MREPAYIFDAPRLNSVTIQNDHKRFPVRRIYCVGRNYAEHIREMGADERQSPFFFQKPSDAIVEDGAVVPYPPLTKDFQYETEFVLAIGKGGANIKIEDSASHVFGVAAGIDLTRRDVQVEARKTGRPWEIGKSFDKSAPIGTIVPLNGGPLPTRGAISLHVNGAVRQHADIADMIWNSEEIISELSTHYTLQPGDLIFTGTPAGVGPVVAGDEVVGEVEGVGTIRITITDPA
ncbi:MAG: fumarylacetoacetate hydrolase family protein [Sphingobium sp.]